MKVEPTSEEMLAHLVHSLEVIADGITNIVQTLDSIIQDTGDGPPAVRTVSE